MNDLGQKMALPGTPVPMNTAYGGLNAPRYEASLALRPFTREPSPFISVTKP